MYKHLGVSKPRVILWAESVWPSTPAFHKIHRFNKTGRCFVLDGKPSRYFERHLVLVVNEKIARLYESGVQKKQKLVGRGETLRKCIRENCANLVEGNNSNFRQLVKQAILWTAGRM